VRVVLHAELQRRWTGSGARRAELRREPPNSAARSGRLRAAAAAAHVAHPVISGSDPPCMLGYALANSLPNRARRELQPPRLAVARFEPRSWAARVGVQLDARPIRSSELTTPRCARSCERFARRSRAGRREAGEGESTARATPAAARGARRRRRFASPRTCHDTLAGAPPSRIRRQSMHTPSASSSLAWHGSPHAMQRGGRSRGGGAMLRATWSTRRPTIAI
jgi:hypothetical protein